MSLLIILFTMMAGTGKASWELVLDTPPAQPAPGGSTDQRPGAKALPTGTGDHPECRHVVQPGETLGGIALSRLGDAARWPDIATLNSLPSDGRINHGAVLDLPCDGTGRNEYRDPDPPPVDGRDLATAISDARKARQHGPDPVNSPRTDIPPLPEKSLIPAEDPEPALTSTSVTQPFPLEEADMTLPDHDTSETGEITVWQARRGTLLDDVIARWTLGAGFRLIIRDRWSWKLDYDYEFTGDMKEAITDLMSGYSHTLPAPLVTFYSNDVVVLSVK